MSWFGERPQKIRAAEVQRLAQLDPWARLPLTPPLGAFGPGASDFGQFLRGETRVTPQSPEEVAQWLQECQYATDEMLLDEADCWLHPCTFEVLRCGDCEDFSLWAWRQLRALGLEAEFVVGVRRQPDGREGRHAWAMYSDGAQHYVLDGVERSVARALRPLPSLLDEYEPQVGVSPQGHPFTFAGLFRASWSRTLKFVRAAESG